MRKLLLPYIFFSFTLSVFSQAAPASTELEIKTQSNDVKARLIQPLRFVKVDQTELDFGTIILRTNIGGKVIMSADPVGLRSFESPSDLSGLAALNENGTNAKFAFTGEVGLGYLITVPNDGAITVAIYDAGGTASSEPNKTMNVNEFNFKIGPSNATDTSSIKISATPSENVFSVGASLTVGPSQTAGFYSGTYEVSMEYQ